MPRPFSPSSSRSSQRLTRLSRLVALVLRHRPDEVGVSLDSGGFAPMDTLAQGLATQHGWETISTSDLVALADADPRRYEVRDGRIRARYGHTITVAEPGDAGLPPEWLYQGMAPADAVALAEEGLRPVGRQHVHLSTTPQAAAEVGRRHAPDAIVVVVLARRAAAAGIEFRRVSPALFLTGPVPSEFLLLPANP